MPTKKPAPPRKKAAPKAGKVRTVSPQLIEIACQAIIESGCSQAEAYRRANPATAKWKPATVHKRSSEFFLRREVQGRLAELQEEHRKRHAVTVDSITRDLEEDRQLAIQVGQPSAAVTATLGKARVHGLLVDKKEVTGKDGGPLLVVNMTDEQIDARLGRLLAEIDAGD